MVVGADTSTTLPPSGFCKQAGERVTDRASFNALTNCSEGAAAEGGGGDTDGMEAGAIGFSPTVEAFRPAEKLTTRTVPTKIAARIPPATIAGALLPRVASGDSEACRSCSPGDFNDALSGV